MEDFVDFFKLKKEGFSISKIADMTGHDRKTVRKYLSRGLGSPPVSKHRNNRGSKLDQFKEEISELQNTGYEYHENLSAVFIYEKIKKLGYSGSLSLLRKYLQINEINPARDIVPIIDTEYGEQAQVDWAEKSLVTTDGKRKKVFIFCMILGKSRVRFSAIYPKANRYYFLLGHVEAFRYFGGIPKELLYDNTKCIINKHDYKEPILNKKFLDFANRTEQEPKVKLKDRFSM